MKYTEKYQNYLEELKKAQEEFDANPCKKTATKLSNLRNNVKFTDSEKYSKEYLLIMKQNQRNTIIRLYNYVNTITIENSVDNGTIDRKTSILYHKLNDELNPIK